MTEKEIKQRLAKEWPSSQQISPFRIVANPNFTRLLTGIGDIEYINQPVINYPNGFTLINPTGQPTIVYNPNTNGYEDIKLDLLHHYRNDPVYLDLLEEYNKALKEHAHSNPDDNNIVQDSMWAIKDGIPKLEAWSNAIDGSLRALLYVDDSKLRSDHRYPLSVKESEELYLKTPEVKKSFNNLKTYLQSHVLPEVTVKSKKLINKKLEGGSLEFSQYAGDPRYRVKYKDLAEDPDYGFYYNSSSNKYIGPGGYHFDALKANDPNAIGLWPTKETIESTKTLRDLYKLYMIDNSDKFPTLLGEVEVIGKAPEGVLVQEEKKEEPSYIQKITQSALNPNANKVPEHYIGNPSGGHWTNYVSGKIDDRWMAKELGKDPTGLIGLFGDRRVQLMQKNYNSPYFLENWNLGRNIIDAIDLASAGQIKRLSPTQNIRLAYDIASGQDLAHVLLSAVAGNNGIVTDDFAKEHPYWSAAINFAGEIAAPVFAIKTTNLVKNLPNVAKNIKLRYNLHKFEKAFSNDANNLRHHHWSDTHNNIVQGLSGENYYHVSRGDYISPVRSGLSKLRNSMSDYEPITDTFLSYGLPWVEHRHGGRTTFEIPRKILGDLKAANEAGYLYDKSVVDIGEEAVKFRYGIPKTGYIYRPHFDNASDIVATNTFQIRGRPRKYDKIYGRVDDFATQTIYDDFGNPITLSKNSPDLNIHLGNLTVFDTKLLNEKLNNNLYNFYPSFPIVFPDRLGRLSLGNIFGRGIHYPNSYFNNPNLSVEIIK